SRYGKLGGAGAPRSVSLTRFALLLVVLVLVLVLLLAAAATGARLPMRRGVLDLHDLVGDVHRLVAVDESSARGLEHQRVAVLRPVLLHHAVELLDDARRELGVGTLQVALEVLVLALELERPVLEVLLRRPALVLLEDQGLLVVRLAHPVELLAL